MALAWLLAGYNGTPIILAVLILVYTFVLNRTVFGRHIDAMGGNLFAAEISGVKTRWVNFLIFVDIGVLSGLTGVVSTARAGSAVASAGQNYELDAIAAVFIGGAAVQGGMGTIIGAVIGGLVMGVLNMGLSILSVDAAWQMAIKGLVLLLAVAFDIFNKRRSGGR
jgi:putative multiple sugar transport system permease protein